MAKGQLPVPIKEAHKIGALIAQSELGNSNKLQDKLCYPEYFKDWAPGIARGIAKEHSKLNGKTFIRHHNDAVSPDVHMSMNCQDVVGLAIWANSFDNIYNTIVSFLCIIAVSSLVGD